MCARTPSRSACPDMRRWLTGHLPSIVLFLGVLALWQLASTNLRIREYILPSPAIVARALISGEIPWAAHTGTTALEIVGAFMLAGTAGVALRVGPPRAPPPGQGPGALLPLVQKLGHVPRAPPLLPSAGRRSLPPIAIGGPIRLFPAG